MIVFILTTSIIFLPGILNILLIRYWQRSWWENGAVRSIICLLPVCTVATGFLWWISFKTPLPSWLPNPGILAFTFWLLQIVLLPSIIFYGLLRRTEILVSANRGPSPDRRRFILRAAAAIPCLATGVVLGAGGGALARARVYKQVLRFKNLPPALAGLRILHISDLHLAGFVTLADLEDILNRARSFAPDLVVVTGDIADDMRLLPEALSQLVDFHAPGGVIAVLGNHEYGNGIKNTLSAIADSRVTLLINQGKFIQIGDHRLFIGGIDDPLNRSDSENLSDFYQRTVSAAFAGSDPDDFRILLSHRPDAFDAAAMNKIDMTFAGHTHGGQIGINGRSIFGYQGTAYPWGHYSKDSCQLYTSSGAGHWIPARLNCPAEAPVFELQTLSD